MLAISVPRVSSPFAFSGATSLDSEPSTTVVRFLSTAWLGLTRQARMRYILGPFIWRTTPCTQGRQADGRNGRKGGVICDACYYTTGRYFSTLQALLGRITNLCMLHRRRHEQPSGLTNEHFARRATYKLLCSSRSGRAKRGG